jgi:hypothetical protein
MDADGSGKLDRDEFKALCERLGQTKTDAEITKALKEIDKDGSMEADADEFVDWWVHIGGKKVKLPEELMHLADHHSRWSPPRGNPFHRVGDFQIDDEVRWFKVDDDVPRGSIGHVVGFKFKSGGGWKNGNLGLGPKIPEPGRVYVAWPNGCYFAMDPAELLVFGGTHSVPVGADWRGQFPVEKKAVTEDDGDPEADAAKDPEADAAKEDGQDEQDEAQVTLENPLAQDEANDEPVEMHTVPVPVDFIVGDHVVCKDSWEERPSALVSRSFGAVTGFTDKVVAKVVFTSSDETFEIDPRHLELEVAHADNGSVSFVAPHCDFS